MTAAAPSAADGDILVKRRIQKLIVCVQIVGCCLSAPSLLAAGLPCRQSCASGQCAQVNCAPTANPGFCGCTSGALRICGGNTYAAYCTSWGSPGPGCDQQPPAFQGAPGNSAAGAPWIADSAALIATLANQSSYVALLVQALQMDGRWMSGPVQGLLHDIQVEPETARTTHEPAVAYSGQVTVTGPNTIQLDITVAGSLAQLQFLPPQCGATEPAAIAPRSVHGTMTSGGLHGSLLITSSTGASQTVQW